jgi:hypothetical protein
MTKDMKMFQERRSVGWMVMMQDLQEHTMKIELMNEMKLREISIMQHGHTAVKGQDTLNKNATT